MKRLDCFLKEKGFFESREKARKAILDGVVKVNGGVVLSPSKAVDDIAQIEVLREENFVSRGAYKLLGALEKFSVDVRGRIAVDIGSSTGGFSDVLLQNGIKKIYCVDVGRGQLHPKIKASEKVVVYEETDFRDVSKEMIDGADLLVMDLSFISLEHIIPKIRALFPKNDVEIISLLKPQFECGKTLAKKFKGVILDEKVHVQVIEKILSKFKEFGFCVKDVCPSPIFGGDGNVEYLLHIAMSSKQFDEKEIKNLVKSAFEKIKKN